MDSPDAPKVPKPPDSSKSYGQGVRDYFKYFPKFLGAEQGAREFYDPQRIAEQQILQSVFGPTQYGQMTQAFQQLDPAYFAAHNVLGGTLINDMPTGGVPSFDKTSSALTGDQAREVEQGLRASQVARGNASGASAGIAEAYAKGSRGLQLQQQRFQNNLQSYQTPITNIGNFLGSPSLAQQSAFVPPVSADRSFSYVNPNAGFQGQQFALQNYQNALGASQLGQSQGGNPWMSAIGAIGSVVGPILGSMAFSDRRLKTDIKKIGKGDDGLNRYEFSYRGPKFVGVMADEVKKKFPGDVAKDPDSGYYMVSQRFAPIPQGA